MQGLNHRTSKLLTHQVFCAEVISGILLSGFYPQKGYNTFTVCGCLVLRGSNLMVYSQE